MENQKEETTSRPNHLKLISLEVEAYAGLNMTDKAMVVHFPENERITEFSGDQGVGKTSLMNGLKALMGEPEPQNSVNAAAGNKGATLNFEKDGNRYQARLTKTTFTLKNLREDENGKIITSTINKPKDIICDLIGPVGVSPTFLSKKKSGDEQIEWIKGLASNNQEVSKREQEIQVKYDEAYKGRTKINNEVDRLVTEISATGYYVWDKKQKVFTVAPKLSDVQAVIAEAPANVDEMKADYDRELTRDRELKAAESKIASLQDSERRLKLDVDRIDAEIARLQKQKEDTLCAINETEEKIKLGQAYVEERKDAPDKLLQSQEVMQTYGRIELLRKEVADVASAMDKFRESEIEQESLNNKLVEYNKLMQELAKEVTPNIEGLEVIVGNIDSIKPAGVYFKGVNIAALSESELWDLCLQVWKFTGTSVVYIENSSSLGTDAINRVNWFAENGGHVFISTMQRGYKDLKISFHKAKE
jgi:hypothetical protein